jgi:hypothetical protein
MEGAGRGECPEDEMTEEERKNFFHDSALYIANRSKMPREEWLKYADEEVAFSLDGTRILAHGKTFEEVLAAMKAAGLDPERAVYDHLPPEWEDSRL